MNGLKRFYSTPHGKEQRNKGLRKRTELGKTKEWQEENKDKMKQYRLDRKNKNHSISKIEWELCKSYFEDSCAYCGIKETEHRLKYNQDLHKEHVDHEGENDLSNCIPSCKICNSSKWIYSLAKWYNKQNPEFEDSRLSKIITWLDGDYKLYLERRVK